MRRERDKLSTDTKYQGFAGKECSYCNGLGLFHLEEGGYHCEECLTYFDENMQIVTIAEDVNRCLERIKELLFIGDGPPAREWIKQEPYAVRFIGPRWLVWLNRKFRIAVETIAPPKVDYKFEGLGALITTGFEEGQPEDENIRSGNLELRFGKPRWHDGAAEIVEWDGDKCWTIAYWQDYSLIFIRGFSFGDEIDPASFWELAKTGGARLEEIEDAAIREYINSCDLVKDP
jgi:hypothetical protein